MKKEIRVLPSQNYRPVDMAQIEEKDPVKTLISPLWMIFIGVAALVVLIFIIRWSRGF